MTSPSPSTDRTLDTDVSGVKKSPMAHSDKAGTSTSTVLSDGVHTHPTAHGLAPEAPRLTTPESTVHTPVSKHSTHGHTHTAPTTTTSTQDVPESTVPDSAVSKQPSSHTIPEPHPPASAVPHHSSTPTHSASTHHQHHSPPESAAPASAIPKHTPHTASELNLSVSDAPKHASTHHSSHQNAPAHVHSTDNVPESKISSSSTSKHTAHSTPVHTSPNNSMNIHTDSSHTDSSHTSSSHTVAAPAVPASSVPASSVPASSVPASSVPASSVPASNVPASNVSTSTVSHHITSIPSTPDTVNLKSPHPTHASSAQPVSAQTLQSSPQSTGSTHIASSYTSSQTNIPKSTNIPHIGSTNTNSTHVGSAHTGSHHTSGAGDVPPPTFNRTASSSFRSLQGRPSFIDWALRRKIITVYIGSKTERKPDIEATTKIVSGASAKNKVSHQFLKATALGSLLSSTGATSNGCCHLAWSETNDGASIHVTEFLVEELNGVDLIISGIEYKKPKTGHGGGSGKITTI
jgi:hypothetical protein